MPHSTARFVFINRYYRPDHSATSQLLADVTEHIAGADIDTLVLTSRQLYEAADAHLPHSESIGNVKVIRVWSSRFGRDRLWGRAIDYASFLLAVFFALRRSTRRGDVIVAKTDPPLLAFVVAVATLRRGVRQINWVQDLFPDVAMATGIRIPSPLSRFLFWARDFSLRKAVANVAIGERMAEHLKSIASVGPVRVIHNWSPYSHIRPIDASSNRLRAQWQLSDKFVVGYSGNMGRGHEFETLLSAAKLLTGDARIQFLLIGSGNQRDAVLARIHELSLSNIMLRPYQTAETLAESLSLPDVHIVTLKPELEGLIVPSKFFGILAVGRPTIFIGSRDGEIARLLTTYDCGATVRQGDAEGLASTIRGLSMDDSTRERFGANASLASRQRFGRPEALRAWNQLLHDVAAQPPK